MIVLTPATGIFNAAVQHIKPLAYGRTIASCLFQSNFVHYYVSFRVADIMFHRKA
jgi:hypothetical protein